MRGWEAMRAVGTPKRANTWASSMPVGPAPRMARLAGSSRVLVASRFVQGAMSSRPSSFGTVETDPTPTTIVPARSVRSESPPETTTVPAPAIRAVPRTTMARAFSSSWTWPASLGKSMPSRTIM
jgi:hypothetical protein